MKKSVFTVAVLAALSLSTTAMAAAPGMAKEIGATAPALDVQLIRHGGASCQLGPRGWHYHNRFGERIVCSPRPRGAFYIWREEGDRRGWYHRGYRRWY
jgi:hypothetical protein